MIYEINVTCVKSSNNSYSIVQYYIIMFSMKQFALSVRHILHPRLAVVIIPSQHYTIYAILPISQIVQYIFIFKIYVDYYYPKLNVVIIIKSHYKLYITMNYM